MTLRRNICAYISRLAISLALLSLTPPAAAQNREQPVSDDDVPFLNGFSVSVDLVGPVQMLVSDYGQYEAGLRVNLKDKYFPALEVGIGRADHDDDVTQISYKTSAPYFKIGVDFNILKNKHDIYRLFAGARYAFTSFKYDLSHPGLSDPIWGNTAEYSANDVKGSYHWAEALIGVDVKIWGPVHLGWSLRYRSRLSYSEGEVGKSWYVPGYGKSDSSAFGGTFNVAIDI